jgi:hypothetical protein
MCFGARCRACADHPDTIVTDVRMSNKKESLIYRSTDSDESMLVDRMIWIVESDREGIKKYLNSFLE